MHSVEAAWSIRPVGAPTNSFSARWASWARWIKEMSSPFRSTSAVSTAHSNAAEEDSPAPTGTSEVSTRSAPSTRCPARSSAQTTPAMYAAQPGMPGLSS